MVADIGAGTGLLTKGLLEHGYTVIAVEPNQAMRDAADQYLTGVEGYRSIQGSAETIPLASASLDLLTVGQAFHWFDVAAAKAEFLRVLKPDGLVALAWNDRTQTSPLQQALSQLFVQYGGERQNAVAIRHIRQERHNLTVFFGDRLPEQLCWHHQQILDQDGLRSLVFSRSYMPERNSAEGVEISKKVDKLYTEFSTTDGVILEYQTVTYIGRPA